MRSILWCLRNHHDCIKTELREDCILVGEGPKSFGERPIHTWNSYLEISGTLRSHVLKPLAETYPAIEHLSPRSVLGNSYFCEPLTVYQMLLCV